MSQEPKTSQCDALGHLWVNGRCVNCTASSRATIPTRIVAAACRLPSGAIVSFPPPARHHSILHALAADGFKSIGISGQDQGFIADTGEYLTRKQACVVAVAAGQIIEKTGPADILFSEDVW